MAIIKLPSNKLVVSSGTAWADQQYIGAGYLGGNDTIVGANNQVDGYTVYGDAEALIPGGRGGNDVFIGGSNSGVPDTGTADVRVAEEEYGVAVVFAGDAAIMTTASVGGADVITGGNNSGNVFAGDALAAAYGTARGGNDTIQGGHAVAGTSSNLIFGDARSFGDAPGREDETSIILVSAAVIGGNDSLTGGNASGGTAAAYNSLLGDAGYLTGSSVGGADVIKGGHGAATSSSVNNNLVGDGFEMSDTSAGGQDTIIGGNATTGANVMNFGAGDAWNATGPASGGNDVLVGGGTTGTGASTVMNVFAGDVLLFLEDGTLGVMGHDRLMGGNAAASGSTVTNTLLGDTYISFATGGVMGNDTLIGGLTSNGGTVLNQLIGDGVMMSSGQTGGNDRLQAGNKGTDNLLVGDGISMPESAIGGSDTLVSGGGDDLMYGDWTDGEGIGGADLFVFRFGNGQDTIFDFRAADGDRIDLKAMSWHPHFKDYATFAAKGRVEDGDGEVILHLSSGSASSNNNIVVLVGLEPSDLSAANFIF